CFESPRVLLFAQNHLICRVLCTNCAPKFSSHPPEFNIPRVPSVGPNIFGNDSTHLFRQRAFGAMSASRESTSFSRGSSGPLIQEETNPIRISSRRVWSSTIELLVVDL